MRIRSTRVLVNGQLCPRTLEINNGAIVAIDNDHTADRDYGDALITPGFIDLHYHGCYGKNVMDEEQSALDVIGRQIALEGTTAYLATTTSAPVDSIMMAVDRIGQHAINPPEGYHAELLGIHLEGPFLDTANGGAQNADYMKPVSCELFDDFYKASHRTIKRLTVSPELANVCSLIEYANLRGILVSIGHTGAGYEDAKRAIDSGATCTTHTFNKMSTLTARDPGTLGAVLSAENVSCELIADCIHVHPQNLRLICDIKGCDKVILVTDSNKAKGMPAGNYRFGEKEVCVDEQGTARVVSSGSLAGSTAKMNLCVKNMVERVGIPFEQAIAMVTENPAKLMGLGHRKGRLEVDCDGDMVVLDKDFNVLDTYCKGQSR